MKTILAAALILASLSASAASAEPYRHHRPAFDRHHHPVQVCTYRRHHRRICRWR